MDQPQTYSFRKALTLGVASIFCPLLTLASTAIGGSTEGQAGAVFYLVEAAMELVLLLAGPTCAILALTRRPPSAGWRVVLPAVVGMVLSTLLILSVALRLMVPFLR